MQVHVLLFGSVFPEREAHVAESCAAACTNRVRPGAAQLAPCLILAQSTHLPTLSKRLGPP
eukprot:365917-Chlamydomonas_euryale.AAC.6